MPLKILISEQIRAADLYTIEHEPVLSINLMERAAQACTNWIAENYPVDVPFYFFCGTGNNGGDGLAIARQLSERGFKSIRLYILGEPESGSHDFKINLELLHENDLVPISVKHTTEFSKLSSRAIIIDALLGTGLNRPTEGLHREVIGWINNSGKEVIAIDIPSGMFGEDNHSNDHVGIVNATHTLTFQQPKLSFLLPDCGEKAGKWHVMNIGLSDEFINNASSPYYLTTQEDIDRLAPQRKKFSHKGTYGHSLIIAGSKGMMGAAVLSTRAALRSGTGLVSVMTPNCGYSIIQSTAPEAMCLPSRSENSVSGEIDFSTYRATGIGPGLGKSAEAYTTLKNVLQNFNGPKVIDADALNLISENTDLLKWIDGYTVLTPHPGEFDRLFGKSSSGYERLLKLRTAAQEYGCFILLKGAYSAVATPDGKVYFNPTGNPGMAKGGSGDVLTGYLTGLISSISSIRTACILAAWNHGRAGDLVAADLGMENMTSLDIIKQLG